MFVVVLAAGSAALGGFIKLAQPIPLMHALGGRFVLRDR
jgi:hypothetical protein